MGQDDLEQLDNKVLQVIIKQTETNNRLSKIETTLGWIGVFLLVFVVLFFLSHATEIKSSFR